MTSGPTYEDLIERIRILEDKLQKYQEIQESSSGGDVFFRQFVEQSHDGVIIIDDAYHFTYVNDEFCRMLDRPRQELIGSDFREFLDEESVDLVSDRYMRRCRGEDVPARYEFNIIQRSGEKRRVEGSAAIHRTPDGRIGTISHIMDITDRRRAEQALIKSEEHYRLLAENVRDVIWTMDLKKGNFTYFSPSVKGLLGYTPPEAVNLSVEDILTPESCEKAIICFADELMKQQHKDIEEEAHLSLELEHVRKDGSTRWAELSVSFLPDENGEPVQLLGISRDITDRKLIEDALRVSEEKYRTILENIEDGYVEIDLSGTFTFVNESSCRMLGFTHDEMIGMNYKQYTSPETARKMYEVFHETVLTGTPAYMMDYEVICKDGNVSIHEMSVSLIRDLQGNPKGFRGVVRDVTKRRRAEVALRQSEEKYRTILQSIEDGYFEVDLKGNLTFFNNSFARIWGYPKNELLGMNNREYTTEETARKVSKVFRQIYSTGKPARISDYEILCKDGSTRILEVYASLIRDTHSESVGYRGIVRDVTDRKRLEYQLMQARKMDSIGTLAGGIAHDFNNLLMGVLGNISLMLMGTDERDRDYERLKNIEQYVLRGSELTKQLLGFARGGKYEVKPTDLRDFVVRSSDMFVRTKKEISIHRKFEQDLWTVEVDQGQMEQVLLNLFVNAWQAMPGGGHLYLEGVNVDLDEDDVEPYGIEPGRYVKITVTDTGTGMDEDVRVKVFDPFFTTKDRGTGTGLGLASVYGIVKNHGGFITVESEKGMGASFHIHLPASSRPVEKAKEKNEEVRHGTGTVLLVDDEQMIIDVASEMLQRMGYEVLTARAGKDALKIYKQNRRMIDVVILDMIMPEMGGSQTYDGLKEIDPGVNVLLSSGYSRDGQAEEILKKGCRGFIQKPFDMNNLSKRIAEILGEG
ncbi:MAG: PAS domain S-box protein [Deltaproteobacteria bacterium]|nr:PAS domain S-box protein [Deltaproteobacteria bacterium]